MRNGGAKQKGASYERLVGKQLSQWLTDNKRADLFTRNVLSGGKFTRQNAKGVKEGVPGDLMAAHPTAYTFLSIFLVECKHYADLGLDTYFFDAKGTSFLSQVIRLCKKQASQSGLKWLLVARQNRKPPLIFMDNKTGEAMLAAMPKIHGAKYHRLANGSVFVTRFEDMLTRVKPDKLLKALGEVG